MNDSRQSTLQTAKGSAAEAIAELGWVLYIGGGVIFFLVSAFAVLAVLRRAQSFEARRWIIGGGLIIPSCVLAALLAYSIHIGDALHIHERSVLRVHVAAKQWWWDVRYESPAGVVLANELHIPVGEPVELLLTSDDVIHSFWVPSLAGKVDMIPGRTNRLVLQTTEPGVFRGQCAEFCGLQHALMAFIVVAEPTAEFAAWLDRQSQPIAVAESSLSPSHSEGLELFMRGGCAECHTIRGTAAAGTTGPDLTHIGSRQSLAAGAMRNHAGTMAGWIAGAQDIKPGSAMPSTNIYNGQELRALAVWLQSLQ